MMDARTLYLSIWSFLAIMVLSTAQELPDLFLPFFLGLLAIWSLPALLLTLVDFRWMKLTISAGTILILLYLWIAIPFSPQQRFFRCIRSIRPGMTISETEGRMHEFIQCHPYWMKPKQRPLAAQLTGAVFYTHNDPDCGIHSDDGTVNFKDGRVVETKWVYD
jgi:hypothetical protein